MPGSSSSSLLPWVALVLGGVLVWSWMGEPPWVVDGPGGPEGAAAGAGSRAPCAVPLSWDIARVDPGFELNAVEARRVVEDAVGLWEEAVGGGASLFPHEENGELAIRFVFDDRQGQALDRRDRQERVDAADARLDERARTLERSRARLDRDVAAHNATVRDWNARGGAPPDVLPRLRAAEADLEEREAELIRQIEELNRHVAERNWQAETLSRDFPATVVESGYYGETVRWWFNRVRGVTDREIRVFRYDDRDDLVLVIAHELGHALGLEHASGPDAVMSPVHGARVDGLQPGDLDLLRRRCPELAPDGAP